MTSQNVKTDQLALFLCHSRVGGNPERMDPKIPPKAGRRV